MPVVAIEGRVKRLYSLWLKLKKRKLTIDQVYDLIATRIITPNDRKYCYLTLSVVHDIWTPVPERFKDWIAIPRDNLYQSLHTSVIGDGGQPFEVQIRTEEMHRIAEKGLQLIGNTKRENWAKAMRTKHLTNCVKQSRSCFYRL